MATIVARVGSTAVEKGVEAYKKADGTYRARHRHSIVSKESASMLAVSAPASMLVRQSLIRGSFLTAEPRAGYASPGQETAESSSEGAGFGEPAPGYIPRLQLLTTLINL